MICTATAILVLTLGPGAIPDGPAKLEVDVDGQRLAVYTYKPASYRDGPMIVVFHGLSRNAGEYRDHARGLADRRGAIVVAPEFDMERFPYQRYTRGGVLEGGAVAPRPRWTWTLVPKLADELRRRAGVPDLPYYLIGHSAGGQFVGRLTGFVETGARRHVAANAGAYLFPDRDAPFPYGFGGLPDELGGDGAIRSYLARPLTVFVGAKDDRRDDELDTSESPLGGPRPPSLATDLGRWAVPTRQELLPYHPA
jgi:hypothetical protein